VLNPKFGFPTDFLFCCTFRKEFTTNVEKMQSNINSAIGSSLEMQMHSVKEKIINSYSPYDRFVRVEKAKALDACEQLETIKTSCFKIKSELE
jgi:hypothetical protein